MIENSVELEVVSMTFFLPDSRRRADENLPNPKDSHDMCRFLYI